MTLVQSLGAAANSVIRPIVATRRGSRLVGDQLAVLVYQGRRSGRTITLVVGWEPPADGGDTVTVEAGAPDQKSWWHNFTGDGSTLAVRWRGVDRTGHGVSRLDADGRRVVVVTLDPAGATPGP